jgi:formamidopyrimidine-DNA glycosylase
MPELPEVEITARRLDAQLRGAPIESALAPGMVTMKSFDPPLEALAGKTIEGIRRVGKMFVVEAGELAVLVHLMSAGRLQLWDKRASLRDKASRLLIRIEDGRELRLREFGTQQRAWAKLMPAGDVAADDAVATLGPEAYPPPPAEEFARLLTEPRHLHPLLRDQRVISGIGRSWVDEILWTARLSPFQRASDLDSEAADRLREAIGAVLGAALEHYEGVIGDRIPDKLPMPLAVHRRQGEQCPRCGTKLEAIHFKDYVMSYCPEEQTGGRVLKDRRLSKLLK